MHNFPHHNLSSTSYQQTYTRSHLSLHALRKNSPNSSYLIILLLVHLILFHLISFKPFLLQLYLHSLTSLIHPFRLVFFPQHLNRLIYHYLRNPPLTHLFQRTTDFFSSSLHCKNTWTSCVQPSLCLSHTEQPPWQQPVWFQKWTFNWDCLALSCWSPKTSKSGFQIFNTYLAGSVRCFWHG